jgi:hypothetical protein
VTAAEILLLRSIHKSDDSVVGIKAKGKVERTDREERARRRPGQRQGRGASVRDHRDVC